MIKVAARPQRRVLVAGMNRIVGGVNDRVRQVVTRSMDRAYALAQSIVPVDTGETKRKMRRNLDLDGLGYRMGFYKRDFPEGPKPWWLEFGTRRMKAKPTIIPTRRAELPRFRAGVKEAMKR